MTRWPLTAALGFTAALALLVAPRLEAMVRSTTVDAPAIDTPSLQTGGIHLSAGLDHSAVLPGEERALVITLSAPSASGNTVERPVDLAVVMDTSGSMSARGKIDYARAAAKLLASELDTEDRFTLVTFSDAARTVVPATPVSHPAHLHRTIDQILEGGGTNLWAGIEQGADEVQRVLQPGMIGRIVVLSDGKANVGPTDPQAFQDVAARLASSGVTVSTIGLGRDFNENLMARLADVGGGSYDYVDDPRQLPEVLADELERTASVVARDVRVNITWPHDVTPIEVLGWDRATPEVEDDWSVWLGDMYAGETRKIVVRVRAPAQQRGAIEMASVQATYLDLTGPSGSRLSQSQDTAHAVLTDDPYEASASVDRSRAIEAQRALAARHLERSLELWQRGDGNQAHHAVREGARVLEAAAVELAEPELNDDAMKLEALGSALHRSKPTSFAGSGAEKAAKEEHRALSR